jgi:hypothetical protein
VAKLRGHSGVGKVTLLVLCEYNSCHCSDTGLSPAVTAVVTSREHVYGLCSQLSHKS